jgi:hypothetical protein
VVVEHHTRMRTRARRDCTCCNGRRGPAETAQRSFPALPSPLHQPRRAGRSGASATAGSALGSCCSGGAQMAIRNARGCINLDEASRAQCHSDSSNPLTRTTFPSTHQAICVSRSLIQAAPQHPGSGINISFIL